jgi:urate oxidase
MLGPNQYGKEVIRVVRVTRDGARHGLKDLTVGLTLAGDLERTYLTGDNGGVLPTDSMKNTVYAFAAQPGIGEIEDFGLGLARHFVSSQSIVGRATVRIEEHLWTRIHAEAGGDHAFVRSGAELRTAEVTYDGASTTVRSGLRDLVLLKSTGSEFRGYVRDRYTTLPETDDRVLATAVDASWLHLIADEPAGGWAQSYREARRHLVETFAELYSRSLQQTLYAMGDRLLANRPEIGEVRLSLPNRHHLLVDLSPFGLKNDNEVFHATDRPYGLIEGTVVRAPQAGRREDS